MITHEEITYQLKFLEKMAENSFLLQIFNKFARKIPCNMKISSNVCVNVIWHYDFLFSIFLTFVMWQLELVVESRSHEARVATSSENYVSLPLLLACRRETASSFLSPSSFISTHTQRQNMGFYLQYTHKRRGGQEDLALAPSPHGSSVVSTRIIRCLDTDHPPWIPNKC